jgi:hypothetical protein
MMAFTFCGFAHGDCEGDRLLKVPKLEAALQSRDIVGDAQFPVGDLGGQLGNLLVGDSR